MAKVISTLFISADGVAEIDHDWHFPYFGDLRKVVVSRQPLELS